jgi:hypothetical protein
MSEHEIHPGLFHGENKTTIGGPFADLPPAPVAAIGAPGLGRLVTLVRFQPDTDQKHGPQHQAHGHVSPMKMGPAPQVLTASVMAQYGSGPIVGVARWGAGNGSQQILEFDVQLGTPTPFLGSSVGGSRSGGVLLSLPASAVQIDCRNDANFIPNVGSVAIGDPTVGTPQATASLAQGVRAGSTQLTRTLYAVYAPAGPGLAAAGSVNLQVPAFARSFRIFRTDAGSSVSVTMVNAAGHNVDGPYNVAANVPSPSFALTPNMLEVFLVNTGASALTVLGCIYELGV